MNGYFENLLRLRGFSGHLGDESKSLRLYVKSILDRMSDRSLKIKLALRLHPPENALPPVTSAGSREHRALISKDFALKLKILATL